MLTLLKQIKETPDHWLICLTILFFPLSVGLSMKFASTDAISFSNGNTQIALGKTVAESDRLIIEQNTQIARIAHSVLKAQQAASERNINLPELQKVQEITEEADELNADLINNSEVLQELTSQTDSN